MRVCSIHFIVSAAPIHVSLDPHMDVSWTCVLLFHFVWSFHIPAPSIRLLLHIMVSALVGGSLRKGSFSKQKAPSMAPLTLHITTNVSADAGGITLQNGFVSTLTSASQLDERNQTNDVAMYFMGPLCRRSPPAGCKNILQMFLVVRTYSTSALARTRTPRI